MQGMMAGGPGMQQRMAGGGGGNQGPNIQQQQQRMQMQQQMSQMNPSGMSQQRMMRANVNVQGGLRQVCKSIHHSQEIAKYVLTLLTCLLTLGFLIKVYVGIFF